MYVSPEILGENLLKESKEKLEELLKKIQRLPLNTKHTFNTLALYGFFTDHIKQVVKDKNIDLIIMGTKGATGLKAVSLGSNTGNVLTKVRCAVLAVPEDAERLWQKLRLANKEHARLTSMADGYRATAPGDEQAARALLYRLRPELYADRVLMAWSRADWAHAGAGAHDAAWIELVQLPQRWTAPVFPIKAADFVARGVEKGPRLGAAIKAAEEAWIAAGFPSDPPALSRIVDATL